MTSSFDAYDLMRRSILSSIMGLKRKPRPPTVTQHPTEAPCSSSSFTRPATQPTVERTPHDIYREIVVECEQIERSGTSSPLSELDSCPTSPVGVPMPSPSPLVTPPYPIPMQSFRMDQHHQAYIPLQPEQEFGAAMLATQPPPPYSIMPATPLDDMPGIFSEPLLKSGTDAHQALLMASVKSEENVSAISIEEIVKMVVSAMKNSGLTEVEKESPEEILRRKRQQNNQAAARYRKRQREARNLAEDELEQLLRRNDDLRQTVERMRLEIDELKRAVLGNPLR
ncbi:hypothetical protein Q1695_005202 [Nippostrongylus brasiliensis]|nr:hypothetical protein Q1695_005202 [Nippostrongylus brasiliensis]